MPVSPGCSGRRNMCIHPTQDGRHHGLLIKVVEQVVVMALEEFQLRSQETDSYHVRAVADALRRARRARATPSAMRMRAPVAISTGCEYRIVSPPVAGRVTGMSGAPEGVLPAPRTARSSPAAVIKAVRLHRIVLSLPSLSVAYTRYSCPCSNATPQL